MRGFTLLELLLVLLLIGMVTALAGPQLGGSLETVQARAAVNRVGVVLRQVRTRAVTDQQIWRVTFEGREGRLVAAPLAGTAPGKEDRPIGGTEGQRDLTYRLPEGLRFTAITDARGKSADADRHELYFYPAGNSSGVELTLTSARKGSFRVKVDFITGLVDVTD